MSVMIGKVHGVLRPVTGRRGGPAQWHGLIGGLVLLALALLAAPLAAPAQGAEKVARVGVLSAGQPRSAAHWVAFEQRLHALGYVVELAFCNAERMAEKFRTCAVELVQFKPDVLVASGPEASIRAVQQATGTIPIVMVAIDYDPIARGYVAGLARPGGTITGVFFQQVELAAKRLTLLKEALPQVTRVAVLWPTLFAADQFRAVEAAARVVGVQVHSLELGQPPYDLAGAFGAAALGHAEALLVLAFPALDSERTRIIDLAAQHRLPLMASFDEPWLREGAFMSYEANYDDMFRRVAYYVDRILHGTKPADLPVEQPVRFTLGINPKTAKALGITVPSSLLVLADEVIQ